ncbi:hypothetical protein J0R38_005138 [Salmonella enterica subsp. enterica serovar Abony]|nr:hypothetical protein [Salmonella enterica subsp. enterica serovar Abony]
MSAARTDGFIRNIHSRNPFDVIRADVVIVTGSFKPSGLFPPALQK